jgi:transcription antitermination protein NusB
MISRRLVRIKTLQALYSWKQVNDVPSTPLTKELYERLSQVHECYLFLLDFPYQLREFAMAKQSFEKEKYYPSQEKIDHFSLLNGTTVLDKIHNQVIQAGYYRFNWSDVESNFETWFQDLKSLDFARDYSIFFTPNHDQQKDFIESMLYVFLESHEGFNHVLEELYPVWFDDAAFTVRDVLKTIELSKDLEALQIKKGIKPTDEEVIWSAHLLSNTIKNADYYEALISEVTQNWDPSRIAVIDLLILKLTLTEFLTCPEIPLAVTINEYLEITKNYSTPNSSKFVNGIMDKLRIQLENKGEIKKTGRGLK